ncbi:hypothetical protein GDO81_005151 [Engystomops pustulosus]|uniref:Uncharacterized protein n=1 Tax=Engystomops pustulosus TaxID=76066 RepID=A0AAV7CL75_ENGPU|nr:hypothetical protein GDO81_005151 [Engystomops pustulosus]
MHIEQNTMTIASTPCVLLNLVQIKNAIRIFIIFKSSNLCTKTLVVFLLWSGLGTRFHFESTCLPQCLSKMKHDILALQRGVQYIIKLNMPLRQKTSTAEHCIYPEL